MGLLVISRTWDIHRQTSFPLTLQIHQFSRVIYKASRKGRGTPCSLPAARCLHWCWTATEHLQHSAPPCLGELGTFLCETHNPITPVWPCAGVISAVRTVSWEGQRCGRLTTGRALDGTLASIVLRKRICLEQGDVQHWHPRTKCLIRPVVIESPSRKAPSSQKCCHYQILLFYIKNAHFSFHLV